MSGDVLIGAHSALTDTKAIVFGDSGPIVLDDELEALAGESVFVDGDGEPHPALAPLAGVVQHVTEQLDEVAAVTDELTLQLHGQLDAEVLAGIDLQQRGAQLAGDGRDVDRRLAEQRAARGGGSFQLVLDDAAHSVDLGSQRGPRGRRRSCVQR